MKVVCREMIFGDPTPAPECHASTILRLPDGVLLAAWFAGAKEGADDVTIWVSRRDGAVWSAPQPVAPERDIPHWNPVLFQMNVDTVALYYKVGRRIPDWKTMVMTSGDGGRSWSAPRELVPGDVSGGRGPVKNKAIHASDGRILAPASTEQGAWRAFVDVSADGNAWEKHPIPVAEDLPEKGGMIQPTLWEWPLGQIHALMRTNMGRIYRSDSMDGGENWCAAYPVQMPNNNSGIDCAVMEDGALVLVCNPNSEDWGKRTPLSVFVSRDNGEKFVKLLDLETEEGEFSYPAIVAHDRHVCITYTWKRRKIAFCELEI